MMSTGNKINVILLTLVQMSLSSAGVWGQEGSDWPTRLHDARLTARTLLSGDLVKPRCIWTLHLGYGRPARVMNPQQTQVVPLDLTGDGVSEEIKFQSGDKKFSVHDGAGGGELWSVETEQQIYEKLFSVADVNADSILDLCLVTHYRAEVYDGRSGTRLHKIRWDVGRNYGFNIWGNFDEDPQCECVILGDYTTHVDYLDTGPGGVATHAWGAIYRREADENAAIDFTRGRRALRFLYRSVGDLNGDGSSEVAFMGYNLQDQRRWRTIVRRLPDGEVLVEQEDLDLYGMEDADGDGKSEIFAGNLKTFGVRAFSDLSIWRLNQQKMERVCQLGYGRFCLTPDHLPTNAASNALSVFESSTILFVEQAGVLEREFVVERDANRDGAADAIDVFKLQVDGGLTRVATYADPQQQHVLTSTVPGEEAIALRGYSTESGETLMFHRDGSIEHQGQTRGGGFTSLPVTSDIDGDGRCEVVVQTADGWVQVWSVTAAEQAPELQWQVRGWGMNQEAGYARPGRGVLLADLEADGTVEVLCAGVSAAGNATLAVLDHRGHLVWQYELPGVQPLWPDAGLDQWSVGKLNEDEVLDIVIQWHDLGHSSAKLTALDGRKGNRLWEVNAVNLEGTRRPLQSFSLVVADLNADGLMDVASMPALGASVLAGRDGRAQLGILDPGLGYYSQVTAADVTGDGISELFFNDRQTQAALRTYPQAELLWSQKSERISRQYDNPLLLDWDRDGELEFCICRPEGQLVVRNAVSGEVEAECTFPHLADNGVVERVMPTTEMIASDINGDGLMDLLFGCGTRLYAISTKTDSSGRLRLLWSHAFTAAVKTPVVADVDRDGRAEVLIPTANSRLHCLDGLP